MFPLPLIPGGRDGEFDTALGPIPQSPTPSWPRTGQADGLALGLRFKLKLVEPQLLGAPTRPPFIPSCFPSEPQPLLPHVLADPGPVMLLLALREE